MHAVRSSTFNSEGEQPRSGMPRAIAVVVWTLLWLAVADISINLLLDPARPWHGKVSSLFRYFNHGKSIEGKLEDAIGPHADRPNSVVQAGWVDPDVFRALPRAPSEGHDLLVAVYGQSFAFNAVAAMQRADGRMTLRLIGGPAAPLSHSLAAYRADVSLRKADVAIVGILASSLAKSDSMSGMSWTFENPAPFTFPRWSLSDGKLVEEAPLIKTEADFRAAFRERGPTWERFKQQLSRNDVGYDSFAFEASPLDYSAIGRLLRRGWVANHQAYPMNATQPDVARFDSDRVAVAAAIIEQLKRTARDAGERLIVVLLHDRGSGDALYQALREPLERIGVEYVSTHSLFSASDPRRFVSDGHYAEPANDLVAHAMRKLVRADTRVPISTRVPATLAP